MHLKLEPNAHLLECARGSLVEMTMTAHSLNRP
jgi:hypothetical protein